MKTSTLRPCFTLADDGHDDFWLHKVSSYLYQMDKEIERYELVPKKYKKEKVLPGAGKCAKVA